MTLKDFDGTLRWFNTRLALKETKVIVSGQTMDVEGINRNHSPYRLYFEDYLVKHRHTNFAVHVYPFPPGRK